MQSPCCGHQRCTSDVQSLSDAALLVKDHLRGMLDVKHSPRPGIVTGTSFGRFRVGGGMLRGVSSMNHCATSLFLSGWQVSRSVCATQAIVWLVGM
jgi:hypothetical protein